VHHSSLRPAQPLSWELVRLDPRALHFVLPEPSAAVRCYLRPIASLA